jgi:hypothetical protein
MEITEAVGETIIQKNGHLFALLIGETGISAVGLRILDIYLFVCYIQIAASIIRARWSFPFATTTVFPLAFRWKPRQKKFQPI